MNDKDEYYLILLGGTGAKCGEILVHMCANGYLEGNRINMLHIESDALNGNTKQFSKLVESYQRCREQYRIQESPICFFSPEINCQSISPAEGYSIFKDLANPSGKDAVGVNTAEMLMKALYSDEEQNMKISEGFFAHPNVGAAFFAANMDKKLGQFCNLIRIDLKQMKNIKIFITGSIFGGTGASSFPTISKYLKRELVGESDNGRIQEQVKIGGCMMLPYFSFSQDNVKEDILTGKKTEVEADKFATKTKLALKYYKYVDEEQGRHIFDCLYVLGHDKYDKRGDYQTAGVEQRNMPHIVEFYAAMSAVDFFESSMNQSGRYFAVVPTDKISWADTYKYPESLRCFLVMMRFALVMKSLIMEELFDYRKDNRLKQDVHTISWFYDFLDGREESADMDEGKLFEKFELISQYCDMYVRWFAELNIQNHEKRDDPSSIVYDGDDAKNDLVEYLDFFDKKLVIKQHCNNQIAMGDIKEENPKVRDDMYRKNMQYIREHFAELEREHSYTDAPTEDIKMEDIWSRICDLGFNSTLKEEDILQNLTASVDKSMDAGIRNLINAVFISCMI